MLFATSSALEGPALWLFQPFFDSKEVRKKAWKHIEELRAAIQVPPSS